MGGYFAKFCQKSDLLTFKNICHINKNTDINENRKINVQNKEQQTVTIITIKSIGKQSKKKKLKKLHNQMRLYSRITTIMLPTISSVLKKVTND